MRSLLNDALRRVVVGLALVASAITLGIAGYRSDTGSALFLVGPFVSPSLALIGVFAAGSGRRRRARRRARARRGFII